MPDRMARGAGDLAPEARAAEEAPPTERQRLEREYQQLTRSLSSLQRAAMADSQLAASWQALGADLESRLKATSDFHWQLLLRRDEIEARLAAASEGEQVLSEEERKELSPAITRVSRRNWRASSESRCESPSSPSASLHF